MGEANAAKKPNFFKGVKGEFNKIIWPSVPALAKQTWTVIVVTTILTLIVAGIDFVYGAAMYSLIGKY